MDRVDPQELICVFLALPYATPRLRELLPCHWFRRVVEAGGQDPDACVGHLRELIETVAAAPLDPQVTANGVNLWRTCPHTHVDVEAVVHPQAHLCLQTALSMDAAHAGGFQSKHGSTYSNLRADVRSDLEARVPRGLLVQLIFELAHVGVSSIQNTRHFEHVFVNKLVRSAILRAGEGSDLYRTFMHSNKDAFPESELQVTCPQALREWTLQSLPPPPPP